MHKHRRPLDAVNSVTPQLKPHCDYTCWLQPFKTHSSHDLFVKSNISVMSFNRSPESISATVINWCRLDTWKACFWCNRSWRCRIRSPLQVVCSHTVSIKLDTKLIIYYIRQICLHKLLVSFFPKERAQDRTVLSLDPAEKFTKKRHLSTLRIFRQLLLSLQRFQ